MENEIEIMRVVLPFLGDIEVSLVCAGENPLETNE